VDFSRSINETSQKLGISIDKMQKWRIAAREIGGTEFIGQVMTRLAANAQDPTKDKFFQSLGVKSTDVRGAKALNPSDLLQAVVAGAAKLGQASGSGILSKLTGRGTGGALIGKAEEISHLDEIKTIEAENIRKLALLGFEYDNLIDTIRTALIPSLLDFAEWLSKTWHKFTDSSETDRTKILIARHEAEMEGKEVSTAKAMAEYSLLLLKRPFQSKEESTQSFNEMIGRVFGDKAQAAVIGATPQIDKEIKDYRAKLEADRQKKIAEFDAKQKELGGRVNRAELPSIPAKSLLENKLTGGSPLLKIGGLMGIDASYRLERLSQKSVELLYQIVKNTSPHDFNMQDQDPFGDISG
jgi:hypothetical protein